MNRILVIGSGGSGKSTFSIKLAHKMNLPLVHLDEKYWKPNREKPTDSEWQEKVESLLVEEKWIIDGSYLNTLALRLTKADTIILLDIHNYICIFNIIKRRLKYSKFTKRTRPGLPNYLSERIYFKFLKWVWNYRKKELPKVLSIIENSKAANAKLLIFKNYKDLYNHFDL
jgi:adenylate kinase family enzyme